MRQIFTVVCLLLATLSLSGQIVTTAPVIPRADQPVTITVDVSGTSLNGFAWDNSSNPVWIWSWIADGCSQNCDAPSNVNPATPAQDVAKMIRISTSPDKYQITFTPTIFFGKPVSELRKIGLKLKTRDWADGKQTDNNRFIEFFEDFAVLFTQPTATPKFVNQGEQFDITANSSAPADLVLKVDGNEVASASNASTITYTHTVTEAAGAVTVSIHANNGAINKESSFQYVVIGNTILQPRPEGILDGINYHPDQTKVTLSLLAPGKSSIFVIGDFTDWKFSGDLQMKKDGEHFWVEVEGLTPGQEYGFQYAIDGQLYVADPFADKILDPDDHWIPGTTYPNLKEFPQHALKEQWYFNRVSVLQTGQQAYTWQHTDYSIPDKTDLIIYELHIRDFFGDQNRNFQALIDTISYFKRLGVNAIELMPVMEFNGNDSWGYNPTFMFAVDKYYGTKDKLKEFIDKCHGEGIAVILDIVLNHQDIPNPYAMMDFNFGTFKPNPTNPWFNVDATHSHSVFSDMNHESQYTKDYIDTVNYYWLTEFKADGLRFDLSKGFTQKNTGGDVDFWSAKDDSRIALLKRMYNEINKYAPNAFLILEHFADNSEEKILADYGYMFWGNLNHAYAQNAMGFAQGSDISGASYKARNWNEPNLVSYMESHDEERMMYRNLQFGNSLTSYSVKNLKTALDRVKSAAVFHFLIPGPKMLWQFGELGYDVSIDFNDRVGQKPVKWEYYENPDRLKLFTTFSHLFYLKTHYDVFESSDFMLVAGSTLTKQLTLRNSPYLDNPISTDDMNVHIIGNFDVSAKEIATTFPHAGNWYHYFSQGDTLRLEATSTNITLAPGEFRIYTDVKLLATEEELMAFVKPFTPELLSLTEDKLMIRLEWNDRSANENGFDIYRKVDEGPWIKIATAGKNDASYEDSDNIQPFKNYKYFVSGVNAFGKSNSDTLSITTTHAITSIEELESRKISIYPNPAGDYIKILTEELIIKDVHFITLQGAHITCSQETEGWNVQQLTPGLYLVKLKTNKGVVYSKFLKK